MKLGTGIARLVVYSAVLACSAPLLSLVVMAFSLQWPFPQLLPSGLSFHHLAALMWNNPLLTEAVINSLLIALFTTILTLLLVFPAAKAVGVYHFRGKEAIKLLALMPLMVPTATITMGLHFAMIKTGLAGSILGVVLVHTVFTVPYAFRVLTHVFELVGERHEEQASMLGADWSLILSSVTLPLVMPGVLSAAIMSFIVSFSQYITTFMIGGGRIVTIPMILVPHVQGGELHVASIYSLVFIFTTLAALTLMQHFVRRFYKETYFLNP
jgi:putative spermidine/putrescine transport system permease protein